MLLLPSFKNRQPQHNFGVGSKLRRRGEGDPAITDAIQKQGKVGVHVREDKIRLLTTEGETSEVDEMRLIRAPKNCLVQAAKGCSSAFLQCQI
uniref:Uncharacterized protein n=1 Tax=Calidris pygmaea TaxID=425635 RepID=A0A8C3KQJ4_9CHAR